MVSAPWVKLRTALLTVFDYISVCILSTAGALWAFITQGRHRHPTEYVLAGGIQWLCRWGTLGACRSAQHLLQEIAYPRLLQAMRKRELAIEEYYSKSNDSAPEVKGLWLRKPGSKPDILILEVHGGGMSVGSARSNMYCMTRVLGYLERDHHPTAHVLSIDYPLAPEHPFPAAHNCTLAAMDAILELSKSLAANGQASLPDGPTSKQDTLPVVLIGDSAGANLVVSALLVRAAARQADALAGPSPSKPTFAGALLTSPWFDLSTASCSHWAAQAGSRHLWPCKGTSAQGSKIDAKDCSCSAWYRRALSVDMLVPAHLHRAAHWYTAGGAAANADHKLVSPARADAQETAAALRSQLATRAFVLAGGDEVLLPDIGEWVERVNAAGAQLSGAGSLAAGEESVVSLHTEPGAVHDYPVLLGRGTRRAADYLARCSGTWADL